MVVMRLVVVVLPCLMLVLSLLPVAAGRSTVVWSRAMAVRRQAPAGCGGDAAARWQRVPSLLGSRGPVVVVRSGAGCWAGMRAVAVGLCGGCWAGMGRVAAGLGGRCWTDVG